MFLDTSFPFFSHLNSTFPPVVVAQTVVTRFPITEVAGKVNGCTLNEFEPKM